MTCTQCPSWHAHGTMAPTCVRCADSLPGDASRHASAKSVTRTTLFLGVVGAACLPACGARTTLDVGAGGQEAGAVVAGDSATEGAPVTPRAIAPLSTATVTSQTPVLRWALPAGDDGAEVNLCRDRACTTPVTSFRASGTSGAPPMALAAGVYYWRLHGVKNDVVEAQTSPVWEFFVGARSEPVNASWGTTLDVDGDGYADVVVGAQGAGAGAAYVYLGGPGGPSTSPVMLAPQGPSFGASVASAGDVNGDGFGDVIVGADNGAYVYLGGPGGLSATPITVVNPAFPEGSFGVTVASAGDVNGDGFADVIVGAWFVGGGAAYAYLGGAGGLSTTPAVLTGPGGPTGASEQFGSSVASAGDVNGDGFADIVVGALDGANSYAGAAYVYTGEAAGLSTNPTVLIAPEVPNGYFGYAVATAGDVERGGTVSCRSRRTT